MGVSIDSNHSIGPRIMSVGLSWPILTPLSLSSSNFSKCLEHRETVGIFPTFISDSIYFIGVDDLIEFCL